MNADGIRLAVAVVPADRQDRDCLKALSVGKEAWPSLRVAIMDGAFTAERCQAWRNLHGMPHQVVARSFAWLTSWGGLPRDRAGRPDVSTARLACVAVMTGIEALINPGPAKATA